ncbi:MAG: hypothetical protein EU535_04540 [Promethearchaeota archaeon]|nr:MAG: hypothetical protein EU535_04540 [Candidatus Lokiarchaeota archaeon]
MAQQINRVFIKFKEVFAGRQEEIRNYIEKHFEMDFKERIVEKIEKIDATDKIKTTGFRDNLSSWKDSDKNIIISNCLLVDGKQKRYDYKITFVKEKFHSEDIEKIKTAMDEVDRLREKLKLKIAVVKLDSATKLANEMNIPKYMTELTKIKEEIIALEKDYNKKLDDLVESLGDHRENNDIEAALSDCDMIFSISDTIDRTDLMEKYTQITERIMNEMIADKDKRQQASEKILMLENQMNRYRQEQNLDDAIRTCKDIIQFAKTNEKIDITEKFILILKQLENEEIALKAKRKELKKQLKELDEQIQILLSRNQLNEALNNCEKCVDISTALKNDDLIKKYNFISERIKSRIANAEEESSKKIAELEDLEKLKKNIEELNKEGLDALKNNKLADSLKKYKEIKELIINYIE